MTAATVTSGSSAPPEVVPEATFGLDLQIGLRSQVVHATKWAFALRFAERCVGLIRIVVLARLLAPTDFGIFGIAFIALSMVEMLSQTGVHTALVQRQAHTRDILDIAWTIQVVRGAVLACVLWIAAGSVGAFFNEPSAASLIRGLALVVVIQGATNIGVVMFQKELQFNKRFAYLIGGTLTELVVGIGAAVYFRNAWALVFALVAGSIVRAAASYVVHPFRPRLRWDAREASHLFTFGRWVFGSSAMIFLITLGDDIVVGKVLGVTALGLYQMAYLLSNLPATQITHLFSEVALPVYSRLQSDTVRLRVAFYSALEAIALLTFPISVGVMVFAEDLLQLLFGTEWLPAAPAVRVLAILGTLRAFGAATGALFHGTGRPRWEAEATAIHLLLMGVLIYPLVLMGGMVGVATAATVPMVISQGYGASRALKIVGGSRRVYAARLLPALASACCAGLLVTVCRPYLPNPYLVSGGAVAVMLYLLLMGTWLRFTRSDVAQFLTLLRKAG